MARRANVAVIILAGILMLAPCVNLFVLVVINVSATRALRRAGVRVRFMGVDRDELERVLNTDLCKGCGYNLTSELREGIRAALLGLDWSGTPLEKEFGGDDSTKFVALTYKDDWANIRRVDGAADAAKQELLGH
ncbi:MAG: hypothetical protein IH898_09190 [Planctomycetes bacterium]|nr:hypothetical protein [Planctomycetota bacterium]